MTEPHSMYPSSSMFMLANGVAGTDTLGGKAIFLRDDLGSFHLLYICTITLYQQIRHSNHRRIVRVKLVKLLKEAYVIFVC